MATILADLPLLPANPGIDETGRPTIGSVLGDAETNIDSIPGEPGSPSTDAETLVKALRNVIISTIGPSDSGHKHDANQHALGPDGEQFVIALQKFMLSAPRPQAQRGPVGGIEVELTEEEIDVFNAEPPATSDNDLSPKNVTDTALETKPAPDSSASANRDTLAPDREQFAIALQKFMSPSIRSQRDAVDGTEVELGENGSDIPTAGSQAEATSDDDLSPKDVVDTAVEAERAPNSSAYKEDTNQERLALVKVPHEESPDRTVISMGDFPSISDTDTFEQQKSIFIKKALDQLHKHVYDTMPIRLLHFKLVNSKLQITFIERDEIYAHIASNLENGIDFLDVPRNIAGFERFLERFRPLPPRMGAKYDAAKIREQAERDVIRGYIMKHAAYAILSHTWLRGGSREVTYSDWIRGEFDVQQPGYRKLANFCKTAWKDYKVAFGWMDTICIDKDSSAELDESIRSMYKWYQGARVCITYLAETVTLSDMPCDTWFTRGWTLQELLAPVHIKFYNTDWDRLVKSLESDTDDLIITKTIEEATTITAEELKQCKLTNTIDEATATGLGVGIFGIPISRRMQMAAKREVTRSEDSAYSLMGIVNVSIATAYGEGAERAFARLLQAVLNSTPYGIVDIFNWAGPNRSKLTALLPSRLQGYLDCSSILDSNFFPTKPPAPIMVTHLGLRITILLMPAIPIERAIRVPWRDYHAIADIYLHRHKSAVFLDDTDTISESYSVLDARTDRISDENTWDNSKQLALGVLNIGSAAQTSIMVPFHCLAVALKSSFDGLQKVATKAPVTFHLKEISDPSFKSRSNCYFIERSKLETHGMKLATLIL